MTTNWKALSMACLSVLMALSLIWSAQQFNGTRLPQINAKEAKTIWAQAQHWQEQGRSKKSLRLTNRLLRSFPSNPIYLSFKADILRSLKLYDEESQVWELFLLTAPFPTEACPQLGRSYTNLGLVEKAIDAHRRCLSLDPDKSDLILFLALALEREGQDEEAKRLYRKILEKNSDYSDASLGLARLLTAQGYLQEAQELINKVLQRSVSNSDALLAAANLANQQNNRIEAKNYLRRAIQTSPRYGDLYRILGRWLEEDNELQEAASIYMSLSRLEPENITIKNKIENLRQP